jgi:hypothetical protein
MEQIAVLVAMRELGAVQRRTAITLSFGAVAGLARLVVDTTTSGNGVSVSGERIPGGVGLLRHKRTDTQSDDSDERETRPHAPVTPLHGGMLPEFRFCGSAVLRFWVLGFWVLDCSF